MPVVIADTENLFPQDWICGLKLISGSMGEQHSVCYLHTQNYRVSIFKVIVSVIDPLSKGRLQLLCNPFVLFFPEPS